MLWGILIDRDIASLRKRFERALVHRPDSVPRKSRQECLDGVQRSLRRGDTTEWVRSALDLATHTVFRTERILGPEQFASNSGTVGNKRGRITDFKHWDQLCTFLDEKYGVIVEELKLLLIAGSYVETESIVSREIDGLIDPYRATRGIEARIRHHVAEKPRGFDIESLKNLAAQYNHTDGTPFPELVELGLSNIIDLHSNEAICHEYQRIFVNRSSEHSRAVQGIALFALSYKHEGHGLRMSKNSFLEVCNAMKTRGFKNVQLWIDAVCSNVEKRSGDTWARRGLLPYTVLPILIHNNEFYDKGRERIWLKLERVASSGRSGVIYTRPTDSNQILRGNCVTGDSRDLVAGCILAEDYDPQSVTFTNDVTDLRAWATEHFTVSTFRSYFGLSRIGNGDVSEELKQECIYSGVLKYNEVMPHRKMRLVAKCPKDDKSTDGVYHAIKGRAHAKNERLMTYICRLHGKFYRVRLSLELGTSVLRISAVRGLRRRYHVTNVYKTSADERQHVLHALTHGLIRLAAKRKSGVWGSVAGQQCHSRSGSSHGSIFLAARNMLQSTWKKTAGEDAQTRNDTTIAFDAWGLWPEVFPSATLCRRPPHSAKENQRHRKAQRIVTDLLHLNTNNSSPKNELKKFELR